MADTPVAGLPVGNQATVSGADYTVSYLLNNPRMIDRRLGEAVDFRYWADRILPNVGAPGGGVIIYQEWDARYATLTRNPEPLAPDAEVPLAPGFEGELKSVAASADGLGYTITRTQEIRNMRFVMDRKERALANTIADHFNRRAVAAIKAAITASSRTYTATDWSALVTDGSSPDALAEWPHSTLAAINAQQTIDRIPWRYDAMLSHPLDIWRLSTIYMKNAATGENTPTSSATLSALSGRLGLSLIIEDNTGDIERGKPILFSQGNVGGTAWEEPITTEVVPEPRRRRKVVQSTGSAAYFVDNPTGLLQLEGVADLDIP